MNFSTVPALLFFYCRKISLPPNNYKKSKIMRMKKLVTSALFPNQVKRVNHLLLVMKVCVVIFFVLVSASSYAQVTPANCVQGCTSNDVQIQRAYLSDANGNILPSNFV